jgi:hypothetical protein
VVEIFTWIIQWMWLIRVQNAEHYSCSWICPCGCIRLLVIWTSPESPGWKYWLGHWLGLWMWLQRCRVYPNILSPYR